LQKLDFEVQKLENEGKNAVLENFRVISTNLAALRRGLIGWFSPGRFASQQESEGRSTFKFM